MYALLEQGMFDIVQCWDTGEFALSQRTPGSSQRALL